MIPIDRGEGGTPLEPALSQNGSHQNARSHDAERNIQRVIVEANLEETVGRLPELLAREVVHRDGILE